MPCTSTEGDVEELEIVPHSVKVPDYHSSLIMLDVAVKPQMEQPFSLLTNYDSEQLVSLTLQCINDHQEVLRTYTTSSAIEEKHKFHYH